MTSYEVNERYLELGLGLGIGRDTTITYFIMQAHETAK